MNYEKEKKLVLQLCRFIEPDAARIEALMKESLDFPYVLGQLLYNRMGGAAFSVLRDIGALGQVNREFRNALKTAYDDGCVKAASFQKALETLGEVLEGADFPYAVLKGGVLVDLYPLGMRTSNDLDILIEGRCIPALMARLEAAGFRQGYVRNGVFQECTRAQIISARMNRGETVPYVKEIGLPSMPFLEIDVNFSLDFKARQETDAVAALLRRAEHGAPAGNRRLDTLCPEDFLVHLCAHLYKEAATFQWVAMGRDQSLYKYADIYLWLTRRLEEGFARRFAEQTFRTGQQPACYYALHHTRVLFGMRQPVLDRLLAQLAPAGAGALTGVFDPQSGRTYRVPMDIEEWIFCSDRKEQLYEAGHDAE